MANHPKSPAKNPTGDFDQFTNFMRRLVVVLHSEIKAKLDAEKREKTRKRKAASQLPPEIRTRRPELPTCQSPQHAKPHEHFAKAARNHFGSQNIELRRLVRLCCRLVLRGWDESHPTEL